MTDEPKPETPTDGEAEEEKRRKALLDEKEREFAEHMARINQRDATDGIDLP